MTEQAPTLAAEAVEIARTHLNSDPSAIFCFEEAELWLAQENYLPAATRAVRSLDYSIGRFASAYKWAKQLVDQIVQERIAQEGEAR